MYTNYFLNRPEFSYKFGGLKSMFFAWCVTEIIRYTFYFAKV